jgi:hypothetical protein
MISTPKEGLLMFYLNFNSVKKTGLLILLLTQSMVLQAELIEASNATDKAAVESNNDDQQWQDKFPPWPKRRQEHKEIIPPPPPGPYMSSALSDFSVKGLSFGRDFNRPELNEPVSGFVTSDVPIETFSPDIPWPEQDHQHQQHNHNLKSPNRWMPENGYRFVEPGVNKKSYPAVSFPLLPGGNDGYRPGTNLNIPDSRAMPSMGVTHRESSYAPDYDAGRSGSVMNNSAMRSGNSAYRQPYLSSGKP